jgi:septal ring factor EnvC (AmiA/AmiB activator)
VRKSQKKTCRVVAYGLLKQMFAVLDGTGTRNAVKERKKGLGNMQTTTAEFEKGVTRTTDQQMEQLQRQLETLNQNLRTVRHAINNNVAVIMAMSELSQRNPAQCAKLSQLCLEKAPQIAAAIGGFSELFDGALNCQENFDRRA